jgi:hypothetical protein
MHFFKAVYLANNHAVQSALENNQDPNAKCPRTGNTALIEAVKTGHEDIVELIGKCKGMRVDTRGCGGMTVGD